MRYHRLPVIGLLICLVAPCISAPAARYGSGHPPPAHERQNAVSTARPQAWRSDIDRYAKRMIDAGFMPGMGIAVTRGDKVIYVGSFGVADVDTGRRVDERTRFYMASTTKALTATAVVLEASRGHLQLDAPVTRYVPGIRFKAPLKARSVTIRDLLSMTDGIDACPPVVFRTAFSGMFTQAGLIKLLQHCGPAKHGRHFSYRNLPYNLLGIVLAPNIKQGWKSVVGRDVLDPLGMHETTARVSELARSHIAMPHRATPHGFRRIRLAKADANLHAAGGYFSTARDLAKFVAAHASNGRLDGKRIFPARVMASTHARHADQDRDFGPYQRFGWGYGWDLGTYAGHTIVHRFGAFAGYRSHASFMPDSGLGVVVLANGVAVPHAVDEMADYIYDRLGPEFAKDRARHAATFRQLQQRKARFERHMAAHEKVERARQRHALVHPLTAYAGRYVNPRMGTLTWTVHDGHLRVRAGIARSDATIYDASRNQLRVELTGRGEVVTFRFTHAPGPAAGLEYEAYRFIRIDDGKGAQGMHSRKGVNRNRGWLRGSSLPLMAKW
jgi:CubicO group peptidase (beta-lactamase class C family)